MSTNKAERLADDPARLSKAGILKRVYFTANDDCPVYEELRSLTTKTMGAVAWLRGALQPLVARVDVAFVFGSVARQAEGAASDIDLCVVGTATFVEVTKATSRAALGLRREVDASVYRPEDFRSKLDKGSHFLRSVMHGPKLFVIGDADELAALQRERVDT